MNNWQAYKLYWDMHAANVGPERAVTGLGDDYAEVVGSVLDKIAPEVVSVVFDIGCGAGLTYPLVRERWPLCDYTGLDVSPSMIWYCERLHPEANWRVVSGAKLPYKDADFIICHSVLTHIYPDDAREYLRLIWAYLSDNGRASISIHTDCTEGWKGNIGRIDYNTVYFEQMLKEAGLEITAVIDGNQRNYGVKRAE